MHAPLNRHRTARMAGACAIVLGVFAPTAAPAVAVPASSAGGQAANSARTSPADGADTPPADGEQSDDGQPGGGVKWGPKPPPGDPGPPPAAKEPAPPKGGYEQEQQCIKSKVQLSLDRKPWPQDALNIRKAHQFAKGANNTVAVIDTGVSHHNYLGHRLLPGGDYVKKDENGTHDCDGHGTEVAGIIAANSHGQTGFNGMAPESNILSIRTTSNLFKTKSEQDEDGADKKGDKKKGGDEKGADKKDEDKDEDADDQKPEHPGTIESLSKAIMWSIKRSKQLKTHLAAINISLTSCIANPGPLDPSYRKLQAAINEATKQDIVVVAAAGNKAESQGKGCTKNNDSADPNDLKAIPIPPWLGKNVLSVGSMNKQGDVSGFSIAGPWVGVAAPGEKLISLDPGSPNKLVNQSVEVNPDAGGDSDGGQGQAQELQGTSFAAPYVSGLVSLLREKFPKGKYSAQDIIRRIEMTAQHPGGKDGRNNRIGHGMIDPVAALTANIPQESGGKPDRKIDIPAELPSPYDNNATATTVAIAGGGGALALLVLTAFVMHTVKRSRERRGR